MRRYVARTDAGLGFQERRSEDMSTLQVAQERPMGIRVLAILAMLGGALGIASALGMLGLGGVVAASGAGAIGGIGVGLGGVFLIGAVLNLVFGFGAWNLKGWAWWLGVIGTTLHIVSAIGSFTLGGGHLLNLASAGTLVNILILVYLLTPGVQRAFGRS
jgi:hypothetical protein